MTDQRTIDSSTLPPIIAVDFDGTLVRDKFPEIGAERENFCKVIRILQKMGVKSILWTSRTGSALQEAIDDKLDALKPKIEALDCGKYTVDGADHQINVLMKQNSTISADAVAELSEAELRKSYKLTETALKNLGRKDLIEKYKTTSEVKSFRVEKLK